MKTGYSLTVPANGVVCKGLSVTGVSLSTVPISTTVSGAIYFTSILIIKIL